MVGEIKSSSGNAQSADAFVVTSGTQVGTRVWNSAEWSHPEIFYCVSPVRKMRRREVQDLDWYLNSGLPDFKNKAAGSVPALPPCNRMIALDTLPYLFVPQFLHM